MFKTQRHEKLIELLSKKKVMSVADLSKILNASVMTIRRDLDQLEKDNVVKRVHGGALLAKADYKQPSFDERYTQYCDEKKRIGEETAKRIRENEIIFFDAGTTTLAVAEYIPKDIKFTAITTGLLTAVALSGLPNVSVVNIGGSVHQSSYSCVNSLAVDTIRRFHADKAFISTKAFVYPLGTYEAQLSLIEVKKAMVDSSEYVILLADHSKFSGKSLCQSVDFGDIDEIITDTGLPDGIKNEILSSGKKIMLV